MPKSRWLVGATVVVGLLGLLIRIYLLRTPVGQMNADEAYTGLQAFAILRGDLPIVIRGAGYTAVLDSYFFAPFLWLFGAHVVPLKLLSSLWWMLAAVAMYMLTKPIVGRSWALLSGAMIWIAPGALMLVSTRAFESYGLGLATVNFTAIAVSRVLTDVELQRKWVLLAGGSAGLAFYLHPMFMAVALPLIVVPCFVFRSRFKQWWIPAVGSAVIINIPLLLWNVRNDWPSLSQPAPVTESPGVRLGRFFSGLIPRAFGLRNPGGEWLWGGVSIIIYFALLVIILWGVFRLMSIGRRGVALAIPTVFSWPLLSLFSNMGFVDDGRYAIVGFPFLVIALVFGSRSLLYKLRLPNQWKIYAPIVIGVIWAGIFLLPWMNDVAPKMVADPNADVQSIIDALELDGFNYAAGNYWLTFPVEYQSNRQIVTAVAGHPWGAIFPWQPQFPWGVRFNDTQSEVLAADPLTVAYVFVVGDEQVGAMPLPIEQYDRQEVGGAVMYLPRGNSTESE